MKKIRFVALLITSFTIISISSKAQDTLPDFTVKNLAQGKVQISWVNPYETCTQLVVQRSYDSIKFFTSIFSAQSPSLLQNGFLDNTTAPGAKVFYRIFYVLQGSNYFFTKSKSTGTASNKKKEEKTSTVPVNQTGRVAEKKFITVYNRNKDSLLFVFEYNDYIKFRDSIVAKSKDTLYALSGNEVLFSPFIPKPFWKPSMYIYTNNNGYVTISLPQLKQHKYRIVFFDEDGTELFQIKQLKESGLILDKTNFLHAGWFSFQLFEDDKLKEKNKVYLEKDF